MFPRPCKRTRPLSPVSTIKIYEKKPNTSGTYLNHGTQFADNGKTVCLNIYRRQDSTGNYKLFAAPLYLHSINKKDIPILPTPKGRSKEEKIEFDRLRNENALIMATPENGFELIAQIFPNDYLKITYPDCALEGYYVGYDTDNTRLSLIKHNTADKTTIIRKPLNGAIAIKVLPISVLGDNYEFE